MFSSSISVRFRCAVAAAVTICLVVAALVVSGVVTLPFGASHGSYLRSDKVAPPEWITNDLSSRPQPGCDCVWRIGCVKYRWQVNLTDPWHNCGIEQLSDSTLSQCLSSRRHQRGRSLRLRLVGHVREAFFADYLRQRLGAAPVSEGCRLVSTGPEGKIGGREQYDQVVARDGGQTCTNVYQTDDVRLEYKLLGSMSEDIFSYVDHLRQECETHGCEADLLIMSGGVGELLNSTFLESFQGVRRFQRHYKRLLPLLSDLVTVHRLQVVWKVHEPVTDELIADDSMVRNDLLQEYNALIMEQTIRSPVRVWTSHMLIKLRHIEDCAGFEDTSQLNSADWRCEEDWVAGDRAHREYADALFNSVCHGMVHMPENPCCSA